MKNYKLLEADYPLLFNHKDSTKRSLHYGFECGIGWFNIIHGLCKTICMDYEHFKRQEDSTQLEAIKKELPVFVQIKEKFGTLRLYCDGGNSVTSHLVRYAELLSSVTCEKCGCPGRRISLGWIKTLCDTHAIERYGKEAVEEYFINKTT